MGISKLKKLDGVPATAPQEERRGFNSMESDLIQAALGEIQRMAREMPAEEFFEQLDSMVESSRRFIESFEDDETRGRLREVYRGIVRYALDCKLKSCDYKWN